jgi:heat shock protein HslJ
MTQKVLLAAILFPLVMACRNQPARSESNPQDRLLNAAVEERHDAPQEIHSFMFDRAWLLTEMDALNDTVRNQIWIRFDTGEDQRFVGFSSCNRFFGTYSLVGNDITLGDIASTKKMCPGIKLEELFLEALAGVNKAEMKEGRLILMDGRGQRLVFEETDLDHLKRQ